MAIINVNNFGPIHRAEVELRPLTVFIGPNNTGKSYLALATYSLSRALAGTSPRYGTVLARRPFSHIRVGAGSRRRLNRALDELGDNSSLLDRLFFEGGDFAEFPAGVQQWMRSVSREWASELSTDVSYEMRRCFGSSLEQLVSRNHGLAKGEFSIGLLDESTGFDWSLRSRDDELVTEKWDATIPSSTNRLSFPWFQRGLFWSELDRDLLGHLLMRAYSNFLLGNLSSPSHYLPASRTGILQGHKTLASLIVDRASSAWIESMEIERLPGVITDLIRALLRLQRGRPPSRKVSRIVQFLEANVVDGEVDIEKELEYPDVKYANQAGSFQLHQVSSMVSEIAPLVLFLKYLVRPGHLFIIEEPESHLDPANQRQLAKAIAMMVNAGIRTLVTTHSDIFLSQINNLIQASTLPSRRRLRMGYYATEVLGPEEVCAYVFSRGKDGTIVNRLPIEPEVGITTESFDEVHRTLYDESVLMERLG